jgi:hypothetical protein
MICVGWPASSAWVWASWDVRVWARSPVRVWTTSPVRVWATSLVWLFFFSAAAALAARAPLTSVVRNVDRE